MEILLEHNVEDDQIEEVLEKALKGIRSTVSKKKFRDKMMQHLAVKSNAIFQDQSNKLFSRIEKIIGG
jgi:regulatory protein YycI of two-component signal transduction system YycFG